MDTTTNTASASLNTRISTFLAQKPIILQLLRFAAIGALNTALDFIIFNYVTKTYNVSAGVSLGLLNVISFSAAVIQSYVWNRAWAFSESKSSVFQNAYRLVLVGGLGFAAFLAVVLGAASDATSIYFLLILIAFVICELSLWILFGLSLKQASAAVGAQFAVFVAVSLVGLLINSLILAIASNVLAPYLSAYVNTDTIKNVAKALATGVSLIWNFTGYKLLVFKK